MSTCLGLTRASAKLVYTYPLLRVHLSSHPNRWSRFLFCLVLHHPGLLAVMHTPKGPGLHQFPYQAHFPPFYFLSL